MNLSPKLTVISIVSTSVQLPLMKKWINSVNQNWYDLRKNRKSNLQDMKAAYEVKIVATYCECNVNDSSQLSFLLFLLNRCCHRIQKSVERERGLGSKFNCTFSIKQTI